MRQISLLLVAYFLSGMAALIYEVAFAKGLVLIIGTSVYSYTVVLAVFLIGMGLGSLVAGHVLARFDAAPALAWAEMAIAATGLCFVPLLNRLDLPYAHVLQLAGESFALFNMLLALLSLSVILPPALFMGATFPLVGRLVARAPSLGRDVGLIYSVNTLGGVCGAFLAGFVLLPWAGLERTIAVAAVLNLVSSLLVFLPFASTFARPRRWVVGALVLLVAAGSSALYVRLDPHKVGVYYRPRSELDPATYRQSLEHARASVEILFSDFGLYGQTLVKRQGGVKSLLLNGKTDAGTGGDVPTQLLLGYIPLLHHANPKSVAVIGLGTGITVSAVASLAVEAIDVFEINRAVAAASDFFRQENRDVLADPRVRLVVADGRNLLLNSDQRYDVIISEPSNPWVDGEGFLFTREYFEVVEQRLAEGGVFVQWVGGYDFRPSDFKLLLGTLGSVFSQVQVWSDGIGSDFFLLGSQGDVAFDYARVRELVAGPAVAADFATIARLTGRSFLQGPDLLLSFFVVGPDAARDYSRGAGTNTDDRPLIEFRTARNRLFRATNNLSALLHHVGGNAMPVTLIKDVANLVVPEGIGLEFVGLYVGAGEAAVSLQQHSAVYADVAREGGGSEQRMVSALAAELAGEGYVLFLHAQPWSRPLTPADHERIAVGLGMQIGGGGAGPSAERAELVSDERRGIVQYCRAGGRLYYALVTWHQAAAIGAAGRLLNGVRCLSEEAL